MPEFDPALLPPGMDVEQLVKLMAAFRSYHADIERERECLLVDHDGEWVMSYEGEFLFGKTYDAVIETAIQAGWPVNNAALRHLQRVRAKVLL